MVSAPDVVKPNPPPIAHLKRALPFAIPFATVPLALIGAAQGGWTVLLLPLFVWGLFDLLDLALGPDPGNEDPATEKKDLFWFRLLSLIWVPLQLLTVFGLVFHVSHAAHLGLIEKIGLFIGIGAMTGSVGLVHAHENHPPQQPARARSGRRPARQRALQPLPHPSSQGAPSSRGDRRGPRDRPLRRGLPDLPPARPDRRAPARLGDRGEPSRAHRPSAAGAETRSGSMARCSSP